MNTVYFNDLSHPYVRMKFITTTKNIMVIIYQSTITILWPIGIEAGGKGAKSPSLSKSIITLPKFHYS